MADISREERAKHRCIYCTEESPDAPQFCGHLFPKYPATPERRLLPIDIDGPVRQRFLQEVAVERVRQSERDAAQAERDAACKSYVKSYEEYRAREEAKNNRVVLGMTIKNWKISTARLACGLAVALSVVGKSRHDEGLPFSIWGIVWDTAGTVWLCGASFAVLVGIFALKDRVFGVGLDDCEFNRQRTRQGWALIVGGSLALLVFMLTMWGSRKGL